MSAQHPNILERLFGRKREQHTPWQRAREEHRHQQQTDAMALVALLRTPASHNPTRTNGLARAVRTPRITLPPFDTWIQMRMPELPAPRQQTGAIQRVSESLKPVQGDVLPEWATPAWINSQRAELFEEVPPPSGPLVDDPDGTEEYSALQKLRYCEHNKGA